MVLKFLELLVGEADYNQINVNTSFKNAKCFKQEKLGVEMSELTLYSRLSRKKYLKGKQEFGRVREASPIGKHNICRN